jgi:hypothetical protein
MHKKMKLIHASVHIVQTAPIGFSVSLLRNATEISSYLVSFPFMFLAQQEQNSIIEFYKFGANTALYSFQKSCSGTFGSVHSQHTPFTVERRKKNENDMSSEI